jgi:transcription antitermination factor NusG
MQKNWYAVYTRPNCEKKVSRALSKKGIEIFLPVSRKKTPSLLRNNFQQEPLFKSFLFLRATEEDVIHLSQQVNGVLSLLYWLGKPATIDEYDINAIREFTNRHIEIELEKSDVNSNGYEGIIDDILLTMDGKILTIKDRGIKVNLPSLGFTMVVKTGEESIAGGETYLYKKNLLVHQ